VTRQIDNIVLLLGVKDVKASKRFYVDRRLAVAKSFGSKYVEFDTPESPIKLALYSRPGRRQGRRRRARRHRLVPDRHSQRRRTFHRSPSGH
jgi:hypothetical protein